MGGDQLQPGVEDGETPIEVAAEENKKILKRRKQENPKRRALSTRERGQPKHQQPGLPRYDACLGFFLEENIADKTHAMPWVLTTNIQFPG